MNIIYLNTHDTGRFIQPYGYPVPTPNLQKLAEEGALFRNAYCASPTCSPSRAALLTGVMPHTNGMWGLSHRGFSLFNPEEHLASYLSGNGFETVLCGIQHETEKLEELGYQKILDEQDYSMKNCAREWRDFDISNAEKVAGYLKSTHKKPFFLSFGMFNTHRKFPELPDDYRTDYIQVPPTIADNPENRRDMAGYIESARIMDECVGIVMDALRESGIEDETIVIFTTDHGIAFPQMKCQLYDTGIGVSLIIKYKNNKTAGKSIDSLVSHLDVLPTLCELAGVKLPDNRHGCSMVPLLEGTKSSVRDEIFAEINFHVAYEPVRCVRTGRYKYIKRYGNYKKPRPSNTDDSFSKSQYYESGFYDRALDSEQLFDLYSDPFERTNLAGSEVYSEIRKELSARLDDWMSFTEDPVLSGKMIPPSGALVNYPESRSPSEKVFIEDWNELD